MFCFSTHKKNFLCTEHSSTSSSLPFSPWLVLLTWWKQFQTIHCGFGGAFQGFREITLVMSSGCRHQGYSETAKRLQFRKKLQVWNTRNKEISKDTCFQVVLWEVLHFIFLQSYSLESQIPLLLLILSRQFLFINICSPKAQNFVGPRAQSFPAHQ